MIYMKMQDSHITPFLEQLRYCVKRDWKGKKGVLAEEANISGGYLSELLNKDKKKRPSQEVANNLSSACGFKFLDFIKEGYKLCDEKPTPIPIKNNNIIEFKSKIEREHFEVIKTFDDPETALNFNSFLSKLEKLDVEKYEETYGKVRGIVRTSVKGQAQPEIPASIIQFPQWKKIYNMVIVDIDGTIIHSTIKHPFDKSITTLTGVNIYKYFSALTKRKYRAKIKKVIKNGHFQFFKYHTQGHKMLSLIAKLNDTEVILHETNIDTFDREQAKRLLLASSGYLYRKYYNKKTG